MNREPPPARRPAYWVTMSISAGNTIQAAGLILGAALLYAAAHTTIWAVLRAVLMIVGWLAIYLCSHSCAHWLTGRMVGIRFRGYAVRGTINPRSYPPLMSQLMSVMPFFRVLTEPTSMAAASRYARALMYASAQVSTTLLSLVAGWYAWHEGIPGGTVIWIFSILWSIAATIADFVTGKEDYSHALRALRGR